MSVQPIGYRTAAPRGFLGRNRLGGADPCGAMRWTARQLSGFRRREGNCAIVLVFARPLLPRERLSDALMQALARFGGDGTGERPAEELRLALRNMENRRCWRKESRDGSSVRPDAPKAQRLAAILGGEMPSDGTIVADRRP